MSICAAGALSLLAPTGSDFAVSRQPTQKPQPLPQQQDQLYMAAL